MGRVSKLTYQGQFISRYKAIGQARKYNNDGSFVDVGSFSVLARGNLWGALYVKDKVVNAAHKIKYISNNEQYAEGNHVEKKLFDDLLSYLKSNSLPGSCKIIMYVNQSPCVECSKELISYCSEILKFSSSAEFSLIYEHVYAHGQGDNRRFNLFESKNKALERYAELQSEAEKLGFLLRIRHYTSTKTNWGLS